MVNRLKGEQELKLGGESHVIKFDLNAGLTLQHNGNFDPVARLKKEDGQDKDGFDPLEIRNLLAAMLFTKISAKLRTDNFQEIAAHVGDLMEEDMNKSKDQESLFTVWARRIVSTITLALYGTTVEEAEAAVDAQKKSKKTQRKKKAAKKAHRKSGTTSKKSTKKPTS